MQVDGITLFIFGGVARIRGEPESAGTEFLVAAAGPLTSFIIAIVCLLGGAALSGRMDADAACPPWSAMVPWPRFCSDWDPPT
jgi:Zn-dependent protease